MTELRDLKCCVPKILPLVYDESMSYYEVICKLISIVNKVVDNVNAINLLTFADPIDWDITSQYAEHTVVIDGKTGNAYLSRQNVGAGIYLSNTDYWTPIYNYDKIVYDMIEQLGYYESDSYASRNYKQGDCIFIDRKLFVCKVDITKQSKLSSGDNIEPVKLIPYITARYESDNERIVLAGIRKPNVSQLLDYHVYDEKTDSIKVKKLEDEL